MTNCDSCGHRNADGAVFCSRCGSPLQLTMGAPQRPAAWAAPPPAGSPPPAAGAVVYAGFWVRFLASFIDGILVQIVGFILVLPISIALGVAGAMSGDIDSSTAIAQLVGFVIGVGIGWLYEAWMTSSAKQATLGKIALGLKVIDMEGGRLSFARATGRHFGKYASLLSLLIGYLIQPFTEKRQTLHDLLAGTLVVKR